MLKSATLCAKELELNEVSKVFKQEVEFLGETLETLRPLLDPSMGEKQWALIRSICQAVTGDPVIFEDVHNAEYTVKYLFYTDTSTTSASATCARSSLRSRCTPPRSSSSSRWSTTSRPSGRTRASRLHLWI